LLGKFFTSIPSLKGATIQEQCLVFVENARKDSDWPLQQIVGLYASIETKGRQQGGGWLYCEKLRLRAQTVLCGE